MVNRLLFYHDILALFTSAVNTRDRDSIGKVSALFGIAKMLSIAGPIPRFSGNFAHNFLYTPIPKDINTSLSFADVSIDAATLLWQKARGKKIALFWSGGIDSTVAVVSLVMTNSNWQNDLIIYTSDYSTNIEYPLFYNQYLKDKLQIVFLKDKQFFDPKLFDDQYIVVDGTCGDQIWGCNIIEKLIDKVDKPYKTLYKEDIFNNIFAVPSFLLSKKQTVNYIEQLVSDFPVETKTISDLYWLLTSFI